MELTPDLTLDRTLQPALERIEKIDIIEAEKQLLNNGIPVYTVDAGYQELVKIELIFKNNYHTADDAFISNCVSRTIGEGTAKRNAQNIAEAFDFYGAYFETEESADMCSLVVYTLTKYLNKVMPVFRELLTDASFPQNEIDTFIRNSKQKLAVNNEKVNHVARVNFQKILFGTEHPYGYQTKAESYDMLHTDLLRKKYQEQFNASNCIIVASGKLPKDFISTLNNFIGDNDWKRESNLATVSLKIKSGSEKIHFVKKDGAVQSALRVGKTMFNKKHKDYAGMAVLNTVLGGYFGSRLMSNIREEKGYTYGIGSAMVSMADTGFFFIASEVGTEVTEDTIREINKEIAILRTELVDIDELEMVKNYMLGTFLKSIDGAQSLADRFKGIHFYQLGYDYYQNYISTVQNIKPKELLELANKYFAEDGFYRLIVGDK